MTNQEKNNAWGKLSELENLFCVYDCSVYVRAVVWAGRRSGEREASKDKCVLHPRCSHNVWHSGRLGTAMQGAPPHVKAKYELIKNNGARSGKRKQLNELLTGWCAGRQYQNYQKINSFGAPFGFPRPFFPRLSLPNGRGREEGPEVATQTLRPKGNLSQLRSTVVAPAYTSHRQVSSPRRMAMSSRSGITPP